MKKIALITGITGQDGSYLADLLLEKGYQVHGLIRRSSSINTYRLDHLYKNNQIYGKTLFFHYGDVTDAISLGSLISKIRPTEIYNLAAQSHVKISFEIPEITAHTDALGVLKLMEIIVTLGLEEITKVYQASTSELFGKVQEIPQTETTPFYPRSPYAVSKQYGFWITKNYRESCGIFISNGILFNHESERRGINFVTRKITLGLNKIRKGLLDVLKLGNLDAKRDWGYAPEYVESMWLMLQQDTPDDYVIATNEAHTVREFVEISGKELGMDIVWEGQSVHEVGIDRKTNKKIIEIDPTYYRPTEVDILLGDYSKAKSKLNWSPNVKFEELVRIMSRSDYSLLNEDNPIIY